MRRIALLTTIALGALVAVSCFIVQAAPQSMHVSADRTNNISAYPPDIRKGYKVFGNKCSECHGVSSVLKQTRSEAGWTEEVHRMQAMASSHINDDEASEIIRYLAYYGSHRIDAQSNLGSNQGASTAVVGKGLLDKYACLACHSIAGEGNTDHPLDEIGSRMTPADLKRQIMAPPSGGPMPLTAASEDEINELVAYLVTLKNH